MEAAYCSVPQTAGNILTSWQSVSFSRRTLCRGVSHITSLQTLYRNWLHPLLCADLRAACGTITVIGIRNRLNYCEIFILYTQFTVVAAGHG